MKKTLAIIAVITVVMCIPVYAVMSFKSGADPESLQIVISDYNNKEYSDRVSQYAGDNIHFNIYLKNTSDLNSVSVTVSWDERLGTICYYGISGIKHWRFSDADKELWKKNHSYTFEWEAGDPATIDYDAEYLSNGLLFFGFGFSTPKGAETEYSFNFTINASESGQNITSFSKNIVVETVYKEPEPVVETDWESADEPPYIQTEPEPATETDGTVETEAETEREIMWEGTETECECTESESDRPTQSVKGDCNGDGMTDNKDVVTLFRYVSSGEKADDESAYDFNEDGVVDNKDVVSLFRVLSGGDAAEKPEKTDYKIYLYNSSIGGMNEGKLEKYKGKDFMSAAKTTVKQNMEDKTVELFGVEHKITYVETLSFNIFDENYDMYFGDSGLFTFGETTGKLVSYEYLSGEKSSGFTPPVNSHSSQQELIDYAKAVLLEYTKTSADDCDVFVESKKTKYNIVFRRKFSGIYLMDNIKVTIDSNGDVLNIMARVSDEKIKPFKDVEIDAEQLEKKIKSLSPYGQLLMQAIPDGNELWVLADVQYEYEEDGYIVGNGIQYLTKVAEIPSGQTEPETSETEADTLDEVWDTEIE